ncbi:MAG: hypothetical protein ACYC1D_19335 [Acidimicrobiales bacterium]
MSELTPQFLIEQGGWPPAYARVITVATARDRALVVIDPNGDGQDLNIDLYHRESGTWIEGSSSGIGPLDTTRAPSDITYGWSSPDIHYAIGIAPAGSEVTVRFNGTDHKIPASASAVWAFIGLGPDNAPSPTRTA